MAPRRQQDNLARVSQKWNPDSTPPRSELRERLQDRVALFEFADRLGIAHRGVRFFPAGQGEPAAELQAFLDQNRGQTQDSPWWVSSQDRSAGLDRWSPARELQLRDRESWRLGARFSGGFIVELALDTARRIRTFWRRPAFSSKIQLSEPWDVSLSEARAGPEVLPRRVHLAFSPSPGMDPSAKARVLSEVARMLEGLGAVGEGSVDFFVDGERVFLADAQLDIEPFFSGVAFAPDGSLIQCLGLVHALAPRTFLPQPGRIQVDLSAGGSDPVWIASGGDQGSEIVSGVVLAIPASGESVETALCELRRKCGLISVRGSAEASLPYLRELTETPWVCGGYFHFKFLEEECTWAGSTLETRDVSQILAMLSGEGDCFSIDGRLFRIGDSVTGRNTQEAGHGVGIERLGEGAWLARNGNISRFVRRVDEPDARELRAQSAGRVFAIESAARDFGGGALLILESGGVRIPHVVNSVLATRLKWRVAPGEQVHRGQLLARVE